ncbi:MAG: RICIN domain-containing protein [Pseudonocardiaceae bacterium]
MTSGRRAAEPDPWTASDQREYRTRLEDLLRWAGYNSLGQLKAGAARRGTTMPVATANRALKNDGLPTAEFVERIVIACGADVKQWLAARDALADRPYLRRVNGAPTAPDADDTSQADTIPDICPYPGLAAFGVDEAQWFFGREKIIAEVLDLLVERLRGTGPLMIAGPSGTGKSSLLRAGLLSALNAGRLAGSRKWAQLVLTPTADPVTQLATQVAAHLHTDPEMVGSELLSNPGRLAEMMRTMSVAEGEGQEADRVGAVVIVDQFEDVFTLCSDERRRRAFISSLCAASRADGVPPALVVLGMRADFFDRCALYPPLAEALRRGQLLLGPMSEAELRDAVEKPARAVGLELQPGLVDVMLSELGTGADAAGALPLLAHALLATWQQRDGQVLTVEGYRLTGGITGAVAKTAERVYQRLDPDRQELARTVLLGMIQFGDGSADTRRQVSRAQLVGESDDPAGVSAVLETLVEERLVTAHEATVEIVHEALLRAWPRLRNWIDSDRSGLLQEQRLVAAAEAWDRDGRHDSDLYRGLRLASAQERVDVSDSALPALTSEFLRASIECARAEQHHLLRRARRLRQLVAVLSCLVLIAATTTVLTVLSAKELGAQHDESVSREIAGVAAGLRVSDPALAAQLALAANRIADTAEARGALMTALVNLDPERRSDSGSGDAVQAVAFSHDGQLLVAASRDGFARVWAVGNPPSLAAPPIAYLEHPGEVRSAVFDPTDHFLVTSGSDDLVRLWPVESFGRSNEPIRSLPGPIGAIGPLAFSPDGSILATGGRSGTTIRLQSVSASARTNPEMDVVEFPAHDREVGTVAFSRDGGTLATGSLDGSAKLWDITRRPNPVELARFDRRAGFVLAVAFSAKDLLAIGNADGSVTLVDVKDRRHRVLPPLAGHHNGVAGVAFSPTGDFLATASLDTTAQLWDVSIPDHPKLLATLTGDADNLYSVAFDRGGTLATSSHDQTVRLWETEVARATDEICELAFPVITPEQWQHYLPEYEYAPPCAESAGADHRSADMATPPGSTQLVAKHSGKCVTIKGRLTVPDAPAYQVTCIRTAGAQWYLQRAGAPRPDSVIYQIRNTSTGMCLDSQRSERTVSPAGMVVQRPCVEGSRSQSWRFEATAQGVGVTDGQFVNVEHAKCLDVNHGAMTDGAHIIQWQCGKNDINQTFRVSAGALSG